MRPDLVVPWISLLVALAPALIVPLLSPVAIPGTARVIRFSKFTLPFLLGSFLLPESPIAALLCGPWALLTVWLAVHALFHLLSHWHRPEARAVALGTVYLPAAMVWLMASRAGVSLLGYPPLLVLLTAAHFHYAGYTAATLAGLISRLFPKDRWLAHTSQVVAVGPVLVALGIQFSPVVEVSCAGILAAGMLALMVRTLAGLKDLTGGYRVLLGMAVLALVPTMAMAVYFAVGELERRVTIDIVTMVAWHGSTNALGFGLLGAVALAGLRHQLAPIPEIPASIYTGDIPIDLGYFARKRVLDPQADPSLGMVDSLHELSHPGFNPKHVAPSVQHFYEHTLLWRFLVQTTWHDPFYRVSEVYRSLVKRWGQIIFPQDSRDLPGEQEIACHFQRLQIDGRPGARASVRWYKTDRTPLFIASYATVHWEGCGYMDVALPLPFCQLRVTLRMDNQGSGILLTATGPGPEGIRIRKSGFEVKIPMTEDLILAPNPQSPDTLMATHRFGLLGKPVITLNYRLIPTIPLS